MIGFTEAIKKFYSNYAVFTGRATRAEYWWVALYLFIIYMIPYSFMVSSIMQQTEPPIFWTLILGLFCLVNIVPSLALTWRRLHDTGRSGAWYFISLVPLIGGIWMLVLLLQPSQPFPNQYGECPAAYSDSIKY
ncbi:MAG: DUF805 domain-containing protein [Bacteroides sp.]|nr:DUF805 domain-containing protein [Bacteroides sp.]